MKLSITKMAALAGALALGLNAPSALAHKVVHVQGTLYVIICEPGGQAYTFNGTSGGAGEVGNYLCPPAATNSGTAGSPIEVIEARPAAPLLRERQAATATHNCPKGTHWYEAAKACVANGGHPSL